MQRKLIPVLIGALSLLGFFTPQTAHAQYGYGYAPGYAPGYGPRPASRYAFRHRMHGYVGGQLMGMAILAQQLDEAGKLGSGGGFGLFGGIRLNPWVALELNWTYTAHDENWGTYEWVPDFLQIQTITGDFKLHIPTRGPVEPYLQAGVGFAFMGVTGDYDYEGYLFTDGPTFSLGGGLDFWLGPWFSFGGRVLYRGMYFGESAYELGGHKADSNYINALTFDVSAAFHF